MCWQTFRRKSVEDQTFQAQLSYHLSRVIPLNLKQLEWSKNSKLWILEKTNLEFKWRYYCIGRVGYFAYLFFSFHFFSLRNICMPVSIAIYYKCNAFVISPLANGVGTLQEILNLWMRVKSLWFRCLLIFNLFWKFRRRDSLHIEGLRCQLPDVTLQTSEDGDLQLFEKNIRFVICLKNKYILF